MTEVVASIAGVNGLMGEITVASKEQAQGLAQVAEAITMMDQTTQQNAAMVEQIAAAASNLKSQSRSLVETVSVFRQAPSAPRTHVPDPDRRTPA
jgi:methyl-accepting chemotaxis protein